MTVTARMKVLAVNAASDDSYVDVTFGAVFSSDPSDPNSSYSHGSPSATLTLHITNPDAFTQYVEGETYDISPVKVDNVPAEREVTVQEATPLIPSTPLVTNSDNSVGNPPTPPGV